MRAVAVLVLVLVLAGCSDSARSRCGAAFDDRIGHDVNDDRYWGELQDCARKGLLPDGFNDPELYR